MHTYVTQTLSQNGSCRSGSAPKHRSSIDRFTIPRAKAALPLEQISNIFGDRPPGADLNQNECRNDLLMSRAKIQTMFLRSKRQRSILILQIPINTYPSRKHRNQDPTKARSEFWTHCLNVDLHMFSPQMLAPKFLHPSIARAWPSGQEECIWAAWLHWVGQTIRIQDVQAIPNQSRLDSSKSESKMSHVIECN